MKRTNAVMTGLVPVIHVVEPPEKLRIGQNRSRVDGRDEPGTSPAMRERAV
jgi:hypothetical protein